MICTSGGKKGEDVFKGFGRLMWSIIILKYLLSNLFLMIYYRFDLDLSSEENRGKTNLTKAMELERMLKGENFKIIKSSIARNGARTSLLIGSPRISQTLEQVKHIISELGLPYFHKENYT